MYKGVAIAFRDINITKPLKTNAIVARSCYITRTSLSIAHLLGTWVAYYISRYSYNLEGNYSLRYRERVS